jgi:anti-sigma B factor antagonist
MMTIEKTVSDGAAVVAPEGRLDTMTAPELEKELAELIPQITELTLDFAKLDYLSSAGLRVLLSAQKQMNRRGSMKVVRVNECISEIFEITGFSDILTIE